MASGSAVTLQMTATSCSLKLYTNESLHRYVSSGA